MSEPAWTKQIASSLMCDWFYFFFVIRVTLFAVLLIAVLYLLAVARGAFFKGDMGFKLFAAFIGMIVAATDALFFYLMCERGTKRSPEPLPE
jgi:hypothetical protein